jgi:2-methylcitrate dehydratase PrpD
MSLDADRMGDPAVATLMGLVRIVPDPAIAGSRAARLRVSRAAPGGPGTVERTVDAVRGTPGDPMSWAEVVAKARDLMGPVLGPAGAERVCRLAGDLPVLGSIGELAAACR